MRVLIICTVKFDVSGIPIHIRNYANKLCEYKDIDIDIVSSKFEHRAAKSINTNKINLIEIERNKNPFLYIYRLRSLIKEKKYDIVHIHGNSSTMSVELYACLFLNVKKIVHAHNIHCSHNLINVMLKPFLLGLSDIKFACSADAGNWLYGSGFEVINNGIDSNIYKYSENNRKTIRKRFNIDDSTIVLGSIGTFNYQKNHEFLAEISTKLKTDKYIFMIIGGGDKKEFINISEKLGVSEKFILIDADVDIQNYYSAFDLFLLPSRWEGLGMVIVEAQYAGLQTIITNSLPAEVEISKLIRRLPLDSGLWSKEIENTIVDDNDRNKNYIENDKYEIEGCAEYLIRKYREILI